MHLAHTREKQEFKARYSAAGRIRSASRTRARSKKHKGKLVSSINNSAIGDSWEDVRRELFTPEEIAESDVRVVGIGGNPRTGITWKRYESRQDWLSNRQGIGASDAGAICGFGFKTRMELWEEKTGIRIPKDIGDDERVSFGNAVEEPMRALYRVMYPQYALDFTPYTVLRRNDHHQYMVYTPDGWLTEKETGRRGLWECKSATCTSGKDWEKWRDQVPQGYFCQVLHGVYVGGFDFADLFAILLNHERDATIRRYHFERSDCEADISWLLSQEEEFWNSVKTGKRPGAPIRF